MPKAKPKPPIRPVAELRTQPVSDQTRSLPETILSQQEANSATAPANIQAVDPELEAALPMPEQVPAQIPPAQIPNVEPPPERFDPESLVGLDEQATSRLLGEPSWTEDVPPAKYWQYATQSCVLRVFFFMDMTTQSFRALSYELTSSDDAPNVDERCFAQLLAQASGRQAADGKHIN